MKHLLIDSKSNLYNRYGDMINLSSVSSSIIDKYGFELDEIVDKNILIGKRVITCSNVNNIKLKVTPKNIVPTVVIFNKDLTEYDNISIGYATKMLISEDGVEWFSYSNNHFINAGSFKLNIKSFNENNLTIIEYKEYLRFRHKLLSSTNMVGEIINNKIKYVAILIDDIRELKNVYTHRKLDDYKNRYKNYETYIDKTNNSISIKSLDKKIKNNLSITKNISDKLIDSITEVNNSDNI